MVSHTSKRWKEMIVVVWWSITSWFCPLRTFYRTMAGPLGRKLGLPRVCSSFYAYVTWLSSSDHWLWCMWMSKSVIWSYENRIVPHHNGIKSWSSLGNLEEMDERRKRWHVKPHNSQGWSASEKLFLVVRGRGEGQKNWKQQNTNMKI